MKISKDCVVLFHYSLAEQGGELLESNHDGEAMAYLHGHNNILAGLEQAMEGLAEGDEASVVLQPEQAFGPVKANATQRIPVKHLASKHKRLSIGTLVKVNTEKGVVNGKVVKLGKFMIDVDFNHPFAGKTVQFDIKITHVRQASAEELAHGHAHGEGGHHH